MSTQCYINFHPCRSIRKEIWLCLLKFLPYMGMVMWPGTCEQIFIPHIPWMLHMKFGFNRPNSFQGKEVWKCWIWVILTLGRHKLSCTHLFDYMYQLSPHRIHQCTVPRRCFCCGLFQLSMCVRFLFVFDLLFTLFRIALWPCWERAVPLAFQLCCFYLSAVLIVGVPFLFGV